MSIFKQFQNSIYGLSKNEVFLIGFYASFLFVMALASFLDFLIDNYIDAFVEVFFIVLTLISVAYYRHSKNITIAIYGIVIIATLTTYALLLSNNFNISVFHSIVPLGYFLLFSLKRSLLYALIHNIIVISIYSYGYNLYPDNPILNDATTLVATAMASLMIILFGIVYHLSVENSYQQLAVSSKQKELLLQEVHHRVKNNLNIISSILGLQMLREEDKTIKYVFEKNRLRIDSIAMVHEILYKHSNFEKINIYEYIHQLSSMVIEISDADILVHIEDKKHFLAFEDVLKIGIITNELIINSIKHVFDEIDGDIKIEFEVHNNHYIYRYMDNNKNKVDIQQLKDSNNLGLKLIDMMVEQLEASMTINSDKGLVYTIRIPRDEL